MRQHAVSGRKFDAGRHSSALTWCGTDLLFAYEFETAKTRVSLTDGDRPEFEQDFSLVAASAPAQAARRC